MAIFVLVVLCIFALITIFGMIANASEEDFGLVLVNACLFVLDVIAIVFQSILL